MKVFLIIIAVVVVLFAIILSLSAEATVIYDNGWQTTVQFLFIKKDIELSKLINFILFPDKAAKKAAENSKQKKADKKPKTGKVEAEKETANITELDKPTARKTPKKQNPVAKIIDEDGIVGVFSLVSNLLETVGVAATTLFRGLHIYSLYVRMIIGGGDAADIARDYGKICGIYYPIKGVILNGMKVDQYDDYVQPDFIAPKNEYEFQIIASLNVALILKIAVKAGLVFLINLIKNKNN